MAVVKRTTPLTLQDFLEQAYESSSEGFRSYPRCPAFPAAGDDGVDLSAPVRLLIEAGLHRSPSRSPSFYSIFHKSPGSTLAKISRLSRTLSRRFREGFWRRREDDEEEDAINVIDERDSFGLPSPVVSSCSASESEYAYSDTEPAAAEEDKCASASEYEKTSSSSTCSIAFDGVADAGGDGHKALDGEPMGRHLEMEDKQQLSPVSVMDFPFDDDAGVCSPSFQRCLAELQRSKTLLLHKIRRLEGLTQVVVPVDLEAQFTEESDSGQYSDDARTHLQSSSTSSDTGTATTTSPRPVGERQCAGQEEHGGEEHRLLARLLESVAAEDGITEWLLLDFFSEGVDRLRAAGKPLDDREEAALLRAAGEWARGAGQRWGVGDVLLAGDAAVAGMERPRRWMCVGEEERDVGEEVEGLVMDALLDELVGDLAVD
ncbi:hypothetical protein GUJ93_ZPchr0006g40914 [Zizania palustris]|uniref:DUF4378 domain-containing protein n=1 Tax=Zizania palustris TaxID=103762 RepID=A0A8J5VVP6_ZIZPA|nr:hypothetical protein GUJ93_ZPchr0006g40914 [Zizania palustris]